MYLASQSKVATENGYLPSTPPKPLTSNTLQKFATQIPGPLLLDRDMINRFHPNMAPP